MFIELSNPNFKVGEYIRLSKEDGDKVESESIGNQRSLLNRFIEENNLEFVKEYVDDGYTGTNFERPAFQELIRDVESGLVNMVITKDLSRLGRDYIKVGDFVENYFPEKRVRYVSVLDNIDTFEDSSSNDIMPFKALLNDMYAKDISKKIKSVFKEKKKKGQYIATYPPYGYKKDVNQKGKLEVDENVSWVVQKIFALYLAGNGSYKIADILNSEGITPPAVYLKMSLTNKGEDFYKWRSSSVMNVIKNEVYLGNTLQQKSRKINHKSKKKIELPREGWIVAENTHKPIIDEDTFIHAQKITEARLGTRTRSEDSLLRGLLHCAHCKTKLQIITKNEKYKDKVYIRKYVVCSKAVKYKNCHRQYNNYVRLERKILETVRLVCNQFISANDAELYETALSLKNNNVEMVKTYELQLISLDRSISDITKKMDQSYQDRLNGIIQEQDYIRYAQSLMEDRKTKERTAAGINKKIDLLKRQQHEDVPEDRIKKIIRDFIAMREMNCSMLLQIVDKIEIDKDKNVNIYFTFDELNVISDTRLLISGKGGSYGITASH